MAAPWRSKVFLFILHQQHFIDLRPNGVDYPVFLYLLLFPISAIHAGYNSSPTARWLIGPQLIARHGLTPKCWQKVRWESMTGLLGSVLFDLSFHEPALPESWVHALARHGTIPHGVATTLLALA